jgi:hypothetical protein
MDQVAVPQIHEGLSTSLYVHHFRQWIRLFDRKQVLIINGDELKQKPEKVQCTQFYAKRFEHCGSNSIILDATPNTLAFPENVRVAYDVAGGDQAKTVKIIVAVREPIARELSYYNQLAQEFSKAPNMTEWYGIVSKEDGSVMPFEDFVEKITLPAIKDKESNRGSFSRMGLYAEDLQQWVKLFSRQQILVLHYDELTKDPKRTQMRVREFLNSDLPGVLGNCENHNSKVEYPLCEVQNRLKKVFAPRNQSFPGPSVEQRPFPSFHLLNCIDPLATVLPNVHLVERTEHRTSEINRRDPNEEVTPRIILPNILLIGAQKAGSTAIANWLFENGVCRRQVFEGEAEYFRKEVQFFDQKHRYEQGMEFYSKRNELCDRSTFMMYATAKTLPIDSGVSGSYVQGGRTGPSQRSQKFCGGTGTGIPQAFLVQSQGLRVFTNTGSNPVVF